MTDELVRGPDGDVVVPAGLETVRADGFLIRFEPEGTVYLDIFGPTDSQGRATVIARLSFEREGLDRFVCGLVQVQRVVDA